MVHTGTSIRYSPKFYVGGHGESAHFATAWTCGCLRLGASYLFQDGSNGKEKDRRVEVDLDVYPSDHLYKSNTTHGFQPP